jgi:hypothetical protein
MAYVYTHTRTDTQEVFYVGISNIKGYERAYTKKKRNKHWNYIINKTSYVVDIVLDNVPWEEACKKERELIALHGRIDLGTGTLCNYTNGGEGSNGAIVTEDTRKKISINKTGKKRPPITDEARKNLSNAMKGKRPKNFYSLHTGEINEKRKQNLKGSFSKSTLTERSNRWMNSNNPRTTEVINLETGIYYSNLQQAYIASGLSISRSFFSMMLLGTRKNKTSFHSLNNQ